MLNVLSHLCAHHLSEVLGIPVEVSHIYDMIEAILKLVSLSLINVTCEMLVQFFVFFQFVLHYFYNYLGLYLSKRLGTFCLHFARFKTCNVHYDFDSTILGF